jgi:CheY-like chemotaxis protein
LCQRPRHDGDPAADRVLHNRTPVYSSAPPRQLRVLVADDDDEMRAVVTAALHADGCATVEARDGREVLDLLKNALDAVNLRPDVIVTDIKMPGLSGLGVLATLWRTRWELPVVLMTVVTDESMHAAARRLGAVGILHKPFDPDDLLTAVHNATAIRELHR